MPGTEIDTKLKIVRKDISLIFPHIHWMMHDTYVFKRIPTVVSSSKKVIPPLKFWAIDASL